jgi:hypothetical protein
MFEHVQLGSHIRVAYAQDEDASQVRRSGGSEGTSDLTKYLS